MKKGTVVLPKVPPLATDLACPKCASPLNMRRSKRGPWLSCSTYPKCRGRLGWSVVEPEKQEALEKQLVAHEAANPVPPIHTSDGKVIGEDYIPRIIEGEGDTASAASERAAAAAAAATALADTGDAA
ncbi:MAG: topoisomerase DNA-binding C4 zinc finger domain-containing protein [Planctomycetota bacterium]|nr:topoisomerase DNA-binding C4 zinc finger domain-containing protein [Planctomycetota bacterium]